MSPTARAGGSGDPAGAVGRVGPGELAARWIQAARLGVAAAPGHLGATTLLGLVTAGQAVLAAIGLQHLIDTVGRPGAPFPWGWLALVLVCGISGAVLPLVHRYLAAEQGRRVEARVQRTLFGWVNGFVGLARFEEPARVDQLRLAQAAAFRTPQSVIGGATDALQSGLQLIGFVAAVWAIWPAQLGFAFGAAVAVAVAEFRLARRGAAVAVSTAQSHRRRLFFQTLLTDAAAAKEVRLYGAGEYLAERMMTTLRRTNDTERRADRAVLLARVGLGLLSWTLAAIGLSLAVRRVSAGDLTVGQLVLLIGAFGAVQSGVGGLLGAFGQTYQALLAFGSYRELGRAGADLPRGTRPAPPLVSGIELRDVWFRYDDDGPWILRGVSLRLDHDVAVGLVGANGAGKSTLVKLLCRFYDPQRGAILWDGVDIRTFDPDSLRRRTGAVFQDFVRYDLTAAENIGLGDLSAGGDEARIRAAATRAGADGFLSALRDGYETMLSRIFFHDEDHARGAGVNLSGGQWQRVALARSMMREDADLLILDEPSSGLDPEAEYQVHRALHRFRGGRASLLISHRLGALRPADRIVVLAEGRVVESGHHDDLIRAGGVYAQLFARQAEGYQELAEVGP